MTEEAEKVVEQPEERGVLASPWFWRGVWLLIASLMLLLLVYEFFWLD